MSQRGIPPAQRLISPGPHFLIGKPSGFSPSSALQITSYHPSCTTFSSCLYTTEVSQRAAKRHPGLCPRTDPSDYSYYSCCVTSCQHLGISVCIYALRYARIKLVLPCRALTNKGLIIALHQVTSAKRTYAPFMTDGWAARNT